MTDYYVDKDNGNDANSGLTEALAKATIQAAVTLATGTRGGVPDTIYIQKAAAAYAETVTIGDKEMRFVGYQTTITDGVQVPIDGASTRANAFTGTFSSNFCYQWFENLEIYNHTGDGITLNSSSNRATHIINCSIHDNGGNGVYTTSNSYGVFVANSAFYNNTGDGLEVALSQVGMRLINSLFYKNGAKGATCDAGSATNCIFAANGTGGLILTSRSVGVESCVFDGNTGEGLYCNLVATDSLIARNCVFSNNTTYGLRSATSTLYYITDCGFYGNSTADINGGVVGVNLNMLTSDPAYVARYNSSTNTNPLNFDYRITNAAYRGLTRQLGPFVGDSDWASFVNIGAQHQSVSSGITLVNARRNSLIGR